MYVQNLLPSSAVLFLAGRFGLAKGETKELPDFLSNDPGFQSSLTAGHIQVVAAPEAVTSSPAPAVEPDPAAPAVGDTPTETQDQTTRKTRKAA